MKAIITFLVLISNFAVFAQADQVAGDYKLVSGDKVNFLLEYELTLNPDGTFSFYYHRYIKQGIPTDDYHHAKGTWTVKDNVVSFFSDKQKDLNEKDSLDFTNTVARYVTKSPRDKSEKIVKTRLQFLESDIAWIKKLLNFLKYKTTARICNQCLQQ